MFDGPRTARTLVFGQHSAAHHRVTHTAMPTDSTLPAAPPAAPHRVCAVDGDVRVDWPVAPGQTILQGADAAGLELASSCRNGTCRTCLCRLVHGQVRYRIEWPGVSREEQAEGWILPCVAEPLGDLELADAWVQPGGPRRSG